MFLGIMKNKYISLFLWIVGLIIIGNVIGYATKPDTSNWYNMLSRSALTPPNYVFPLVWGLLYTAIGICGWIIWHSGPLKHIKFLYIAQLLFNWSWTPLFFSHHLIGCALIILICMDFLVAGILYKTHKTLKGVFFLMLPYAWWLLFATYLNFYIWLNN